MVVLNFWHTIGSVPCWFSRSRIQDQDKLFWSISIIFVMNYLVLYIPGYLLPQAVAHSSYLSLSAVSCTNNKWGCQFHILDIFWYLTFFFIKPPVSAAEQWKLRHKFRCHFIDITQQQHAHRCEWILFQSFFFCGVGWRTIHYISTPGHHCKCLPQ